MMETETAFRVALKGGHSEEEYPEALEHLVELAVEFSTGHKPEDRSERTRVSVVELTRPEYIVASRDGLESFCLDPEDPETEQLLRKYRDEGMVIVPYRYSAIEDGEQMILAMGSDLGAKLCECLHEKRHARKKEGGLDGMRLDQDYFGKGDAESQIVVGEAGLIEEAACDAMAEYDMLVLSNIASDPEMREMLRDEVTWQRRTATEKRKLIERRRKALAEGTEAGKKKARIILLKFGGFVADTMEEEKIYDRIEEAIRYGREEKALALKRELAQRLEGSQPEVSRMILEGECDLEDLLHCQMTHYSHYFNSNIELPVRKLLRYVAPKTSEVAAGKASNPFIDLIGIHAGLDELFDTVEYAADVAPLGEKRLLIGIEREAAKLTKKRLDTRYEGLRHLHVLAAVTRRKGIDISSHLEAISSLTFPKDFGEDVGRFLFLYGRRPE